MRNLQNGGMQMKLAQCSCGECLRCVREYDMYWNHNSMPKKSSADDAIKKIFEIADKDVKTNVEKTKE